MIAKYDGECCECGVEIRAGDEQWYEDRKTYCMDCKPAPRGGGSRGGYRGNTGGQRPQQRREQPARRDDHNNDPPAQRGDDGFVQVPRRALETLITAAAEIARYQKGARDDR